MPSSSGGGFGGGGSFGGGFHSSGGGHHSNQPMHGISSRPFAGARRYSYINHAGVMCVFYSATRPRKLNITSTIILFSIGIIIAMIISGFVIGSMIPKKIPERQCIKSDYYYIDNAGILSGDEINSSFASFYEVTGIQPILYTIKAENFPKQYGPPTTKYALEDFAYDLYLDKFDDEGHWLFILVDFGDMSPYFGWIDMAGDNTRTIINDSFFRAFQKDLQAKMDIASTSLELTYSDAFSQAISTAKDNAFKSSIEVISPIIFISVSAILVIGALVYGIVNSVKNKLMIDGYLDAEQNNPSNIIKDKAPFIKDEAPSQKDDDPFIKDENSSYQEIKDEDPFS